MMETPEITIALVLNELEELSFVATRDLKTAMPSIEPFGVATTAAWAATGRDLFLFDRDAGKAFLRASPGLAGATGEVESWTGQARGFLGLRGSWKALTAYLAQFAEAHAVFGAGGALEWGEAGLGLARAHLESAEVYFSLPPARLADARGLAGLREIIEPLRALQVARGLPAGLALPGALDVRAAFGAAAVAPWATRGADILRAGRLRGESFFRLEGKDSEEALLAALPGLRTQEQERFLGLFVHAVFGASPPLRPLGLRLGARPFVETDGLTLFVPAAFPDAEEALAALLHHAGHLAFGSYETGRVHALFREMGMTHPPLDDNQNVTWRPLFAAFGDDMARFQLLFDLLEDFRIDARIQARLPNHVPRLLALAGQAPAGRVRPYFEAAVESLEMLVGRRPLISPWSELIAADADILTAFRLARVWYETNTWPAVGSAERLDAYLPGRSPNTQRPVYPRAGILGRESPEEVQDGQGAPATQAPAAKTEREASGGEDPDLEIPPEDTSGSGGRVGVGRPQPAASSRRLRQHRPGQPAGAAYPEWDYREKAYRRDWAHVQERALTETDAGCAQDLLLQHAGLLRRLRRAVQAEKPQRPIPLRRQLEGEDLDLDAAVAYVADRHSGMQPPASVYRQRRPLARDTGVLLLADLSTSIMQQSADGNGRVVDRLKAALLLFAVTLEEIGDPYAIAGFASKYRDAVSYYPIKPFDERLTAHQRAVLGGLSGRLATRMGAAIRHACMHLGRAGTGRRLLLILSDGRPADYDDGGDERYLHEDTRMAIKEAADRGIHAFCVTLDPGGGAYLERIFGRGHYLVIDQLNELPSRLPQIYLRLRDR